MSPTPPDRTRWSPDTAALHDALDAHARRAGRAFLHPTEPTVLEDLLGHDPVAAWQEGKAAFLWGAEGCWSELPPLYARYGTAATTRWLQTLRRLHGGTGALATDCGMSAVGLLVDATITPGAHAIVVGEVYNKSRTLIRWATERAGGTITEVDDDLDAARAAIRPETTLVFCETFTNPLVRAKDPVDLARLREAGRAIAPSLCLAVDDTLATPWGPREPLLDGVDLVLGSSTKALGGDDTSLGGYLVGRDSALMNRLMDLQALRGGVLDQRRAAALADGIETAEARFRQRCASATRLAARLAAHPAVEAVHHPSLPDHPDADVIARAYALPGSVLSFRLTDATDAEHRHAADVLAMTGCIRVAASFDGLVTKVNHHATVSEYHTPGPARRKRGLERLLRLGVGVEAVEDLEAALLWMLEHWREVSAEEVAAWQAGRREALGLREPS